MTEHTGIIPYDPYRGAADLGRLWVLKKGKQELSLYLHTHPLPGWELRLNIDGELRESKTVRTQDAIFEGLPDGEELSDHEIEQRRLEELRFFLNLMLRGTHAFALPIKLSISVTDSIETIHGCLPDVVLYLAIRLMADSGLTIGECEAPEASDPGYPNNYDEPCHGMFVVQRSGKRRRRFCDGACKQRARNPKWKKHMKELRRIEKEKE